MRPRSFPGSPIQARQHSTQQRIPAVVTIVIMLLALVLVSCSLSPVLAFLPQRLPFINHQAKFNPLSGTKGDKHSSNGAFDTALKRVPADLEGMAIPFVDTSISDSKSGNALKFIECYADSICTIDGVEYTIAVPCDYSVALCYSSDGDQLLPVELSDTATMDDLFPVAEAIVADEFGEELVLQRTPQTLTLVGELEDDDTEDGDEVEDEDDDDDGSESVEVLLQFTHRDKEFLLVRLLDPILLVGKKVETEDDEVTMDMRVLLTPEESDKVMPVLEDLFLKFHDDEYYEDEDDNDDFPDDITIVQS